MNLSYDDILEFWKEQIVEHCSEDDVVDFDPDELDDQQDFLSVMETVQNMEDGPSDSLLLSMLIESIGRALDV